MWVYDVALSLVLAQLIRMVEDRPPERRPGWWSGVVRQLRVQAVISDFELDLDLGLAEDERAEWAGLLVEAADRVRERGVLTAAEAADWTVLDDLPVRFRGTDPVDTEPFAELGYALAELIRGGLPEPAAGGSWFYGVPGGRRAMPAGAADDG
jgi:hypothetical protein